MSVVSAQIPPVFEPSKPFWSCFYTEVEDNKNNRYWIDKKVKVLEPNDATWARKNLKVESCLKLMQKNPGILPDPEGSLLVLGDNTPQLPSDATLQIPVVQPRVVSPIHTHHSNSPASFFRSMFSPRSSPAPSQDSRPASPLLPDLASFHPHPALSLPGQRHAADGWISREGLRRKMRECAREFVEIDDDSLDRILSKAKQIDQDHSQEHYLPGKKSSLPRSLLSGLNRKGNPTVYLLMTHTKNGEGKDRSIGSGTFGEAKYFIDLKSGEIIATKVTKEKKNEKVWPYVREMTLEEARIMQRLKGKEGIVEFYFIRDIEKKIYLGMENCEHGDLVSRLSKPLTEREALLYAIDIAKGLKAIHEEGLSHRDLKPDNILCRADGHAAIADFGFTKGKNRRVHKEGTPDYWSPEKCAALLGPNESSRKIDHRIDDIWAFGMILHVLFHEKNRMLYKFQKKGKEETDEVFIPRREAFLKSIAEFEDQSDFPGVSNERILAILKAIFTQEERAGLDIDMILAVLQTDPLFQRAQ